MRAVSFSIDRAAIQERAYYLWEARGRPRGSALTDWLQAERDAVAELVAQACGQPIEVTLDEQRRDAAYGLVEFDHAWTMRRHLGLVELALPEKDNAKRRYGLVELEDSDVAGQCARYGLIELVRHKRIGRRYGLVELPARR